MRNIWFAEIYTPAGQSTGIRANLPDLASVLELIYDVRRNVPSQTVRISPPDTAGVQELETLRKAGATIVAANADQ